MTDLVELGIKVSSKDLKEAENQFDRTGSAAGRAQSRFDSTGAASDKMADSINKAVGSLKHLVEGYLGFEALKSFIDHVVEVNKNLDALTGTLATVTGSLGKAKDALKALNEWADHTPFSLEDAVAAFTKLRLAGIAPTEERLTAFGNIAATMRVPLSSLTDAIAQAGEGMFKGLNQFGVHIVQFNDTLRVTFNGQTQVIKNNGRDLIDYLQKLGSTKFSTGLADQMETLGGSSKTVGDRIEAFYRKVGDSGATAAFIRFNKETAEAIENSDDLAESLGENLGKAINGLLDGIHRLTTDLKPLREIFIAIAAGAAAGWVASFLAAIPVVGTLATAFGLLFVEGGAMVVFTSLVTTLGTALKGLFTIILGNPIGLLVTSIVLVTQYFGGWEKSMLDLEATFVVLAAEFEKFGMKVVNVANAIWEGFKGAFGNIKNILTAFKDDLADFISHPTLSGPSMTKFAAALSAGVTAGFADAYAKASVDGDKLAADIDEKTSAKLLELQKKMDALNHPTADPATKKTGKSKGGKIDDFAGGDTGTGAAGALQQQYDLIVSKYIDKLKQANELLTLSALQQEKLSAEFAVQNELKQKGLKLSQKDKDTIDQLVEQHHALAKVMGEIDDLMTSVSQNFQSSLKSMLQHGSHGMKSMLDGWSDMFYDWISKVMNENFFQPIFDALTGGLKQAFSSAGGGGGGLGGIFGSLFSGISGIFGGGSSTPAIVDGAAVNFMGDGAGGQMLAFADGGSATVGGVGGIDSQVVKFKASPNEQVLIRRPNTDMGDGGGKVTVNVINNSNNTQSTVQQGSDGMGGKSIDVYIDEINAKNLRSSGSQTRKAMSQEFSTQQRLATR